MLGSIFNQPYAKYVCSALSLMMRKTGPKIIILDFRDDFHDFRDFRDFHELNYLYLTTSFSQLGVKS